MNIKLLTECHLEFLCHKMSKCHIVGNHMLRLNSITPTVAVTAVLFYKGVSMSRNVTFSDHGQTLGTMRKIHQNTDKQRHIKSREFNFNKQPVPSSSARQLPA